MIFKIVTAELWDRSKAQGSFAGSPVDLRDGFIHCSTARQVCETAARHFAGVDGLLLVALSTKNLDLRWEPSRGGELFPHVYGAFSMTSVVWVRELPQGEDGVHVFPERE